MHLRLLGVVLRCGFDPTAIHSPPFEKWDTCTYEYYSNDPFFINFIALIVQNSPGELPRISWTGRLLIVSGFSGSTPLHDAIISGSMASVVVYLRQSHQLEQNKNFLGQTPLHVAVRSPALCQLVLNYGHDIDATDRLGATPLIYAAAMGHTETAIFLIARGANTLAKCQLLRADYQYQNFIFYAVCGSHWQLAYETLQAIESGSTAHTDILQHFVVSAAVAGKDYIWIPDPERSIWFPNIIGLLDNVKILFDDGFVIENSLMHYAQSENEAQALAQHGLCGFNQRNSNGQSPLNIIRRDDDGHLLKFLVDNGADINNRHNDNHTIIFDLLLWAHIHPPEAIKKIDRIKLCINVGADIFIVDECRCPCSSTGCQISSLFGHDLDGTIIRPILSMEWLTLVEEYRGIQAARETLLSLLRMTRFDEEDMTHVCCSKTRGIPGEDIVEILDEEADFIKSLEEDMDKLALESFEHLSEKWMLVIQSSFDRLHPAMRREYKVDFANDTYIQPMPCSIYDERIIGEVMAAYVYWMWLEHLREDSLPFPELHRTGWFERQVPWVTKLMHMAQISIDDLKKGFGPFWGNTTPSDAFLGLFVSQEHR